MYHLKNIARQLARVIIMASAGLAFNAAQAEAFPVLMNPYQYVDLSEEQREIYRDSYFETIGFLMYGYLDPADMNGAKMLNALIDCAHESRGNPVWTNYSSWILGKHVEKSGAWLLYNQITPRECAKYLDDAGTNTRLLKLRSHREWAEWSDHDRAIYLQGYLDTAAAMQMRLKAEGHPNYFDEFAELLNTMDVAQILGHVKKVEFEPQYPLPWSISRGVGHAVERM